MDKYREKITPYVDSFQEFVLCNHYFNNVIDLNSKIDQYNSGYIPHEDEQLKNLLR